MLILLAGASGSLGRSVEPLLRERHEVRRLARPLHDLCRPATLKNVCAGVDVVVSCAGASMRLDRFGDRTAFASVDYSGNRNLLAEAREAGVRRFVYVSLASGRELRSTAYAQAHEDFVDELERSGISYAVVRPTGFFCFCNELLRMAKRGRGILVGDSSARTNPIDEREVARACVEAVESDERGDLPVGGPEILTRREMVELAFRALNKAPRLTTLPGWALTAPAATLRPFNPRIAALWEFGGAVSQTDVIAPRYGTRRLADYWGEALRNGSI